MGDDGQTSGGRTLQVGRKKDKPNWFMIAGGAVAMAVGVVFGRRRILSEVEKDKEKEKEREKTSARTQAAYYEDGTLSIIQLFPAQELSVGNHEVFYHLKAAAGSGGVRDTQCVFYEGNVVRELCLFLSFKTSVIDLCFCR